MELTKQQVIDKILSFSYAELAEWIPSRLHGDDKYFPVYLGHEPNLGEFLIDTFHHIKDEKFRENFLEILGDLTQELTKFSRKQIEESKEYISELLFLCGNIKRFENKDTLMRIAVSGKFKGIDIDEETDLHTELLTTLASYRMAGTCEFWLEQLLDDANKYYANPAFYALKDYPDKLFEHINVYIDKFNGEVELPLGIMALFNEYGKKEVIKKFKEIESKLSPEQKKAINHAFTQSDYPPIYKLILDEEPGKEIQYTPAIPQLQYVRAPTPEYETLAALKENSAEIFKLMGFEVELNRKIAHHTIDLFAKRKKNFTTSYECWICSCDTENRNVSKNTVDDFSAVWESIKKELQKQTHDDCQPMIISGKGFTKTAIQAAKAQKIVLKTYNHLLSDLNTFYSHQKPLIQDLDALISH
jgi:hypothetical protein